MSSGHMVLQIFRKGQWRTIRTDEGDTHPKAYKYLHGQMNDWQQNVRDFDNCLWRIGFDGVNPSKSYTEGRIDIGKFFVYNPTTEEFTEYKMPSNVLATAELGEMA